MQRTSLWPPARPRLHCSTTILHTMTKPSSEFKKHSGRGPQPRARRSKCLQRPKAWNWTLSAKDGKKQSFKFLLLNDCFFPSFADNVQFHAFGKGWEKA